MGDVMAFPADRAGAPPPGALEAEVLHLRRIAARAYDADGLKRVLSEALADGCLAVSIAERLKKHLMAE